MGYTIMNGHPVLLLPPGVRIPEDAVFGLANHNIYEYTRLKSLLPLVYDGVRRHLRLRGEPCSRASS